MAPLQSSGDTLLCQLVLAPPALTSPGSRRSLCGALRFPKSQSASPVFAASTLGRSRGRSAARPGKRHSQSVLGLKAGRKEARKDALAARPGQWPSSVWPHASGRGSRLPGCGVQFLASRRPRQWTGTEQGAGPGRNGGAQSAGPVSPAGLGDSAPILCHCHAFGTRGIKGLALFL